MQNFDHILSDDEKYIIENHFILNKMNSNVNYEKFLNDMVQKYTGKPHVHEKNAVKDYSINLIWDKNSNKTALMHCFEHPKFRFSNTKFKHFSKFNLDLNTQDINGKTALMCLSVNLNNLSSLLSILKNKDEIDVAISDKEGNTFHIYLMKQYDDNVFSLAKSLKDMDYRVSFHRIEVYQNILYDWVHSVQNKTVQQIQFVSQNAFQLIENIKELKICDPENKMRMNMSIVNEWRDESIKHIQTLAQMLELSNDLKVSEVKKTRVKL